MFLFLYVTDCPGVGVPVNGSVIYDRSPEGGRYPVGTQASFSCNEGYFVHRNTKLTCILGGVWQKSIVNSSKPRCLIKGNRNGQNISFCSSIAM